MFRKRDSLDLLDSCSYIFIRGSVNPLFLILGVLFGFGLDGVLAIEVFVLIDEIGIEEPIVVEIVDTHVGCQANHQAAEVGSVTFGQEAVELVADL